MASSTSRPIRRRHEAAASLRESAALTDDLLEEIFLRIASPADLARACTACASFRRLVTDPAFLRRYRSLHPPLLLGFLNSKPSFGFHPVEGPHPGAPAARALASAANFSLDFLPPPRLNYWYVRDVRDGRVLLGCSASFGEHVLPDIAVCDPLSRRCLLLPPITNDQVQEQDFEYFDAAFAPSADEDDETSFRVVAAMHCATKSVVLAFDSGSGSWSVSTSTSWDALSLSGSTGCPFLHGPCYAYGCLYWKVHLTNKLLKLEINRMEFSTVDVPPDHDQKDVVVVEAGEGILGMCSYISHGKFLNYYTSMPTEGQRANGWQMKNIIPVPVDDDLCIVGAPQGYIFLLGDSKVQDAVCTCFSLDVKTLKIERVSQTSFRYFHGRPYFGFPPSMSPRRI